MTHAERAPNTFTHVEPLLMEFAQVLGGHDEQIALIAVMHLAACLLSGFVTRTGATTPALIRGLDTLDDLLAASYDGYERSLARQTRQ